jgi:hypothetical protein
LEENYSKSDKVLFSVKKYSSEREEFGVTLIHPPHPLMLRTPAAGQ